MVLPSMYINYSFYNKSSTSNIICIINTKLDAYIFKFNFIETYFNRNYLIWNDSFLIDFAQKKSVDLWVRKFVILTAFLFSDRYVFESIVNLYRNYFVLSLNMFSNFETENPLSMLNNIVFNIITLVFIVFIALILFI